MRNETRKHAIRNAIFRLGMQSSPKDVIRALEQQGIEVSEELVRLVRIELLKDTTDGRVAKVARPVLSPAVRRCPKGFPRRR